MDRVELIAQIAEKLIESQGVSAMTYSSHIIARKAEDILNEIEKANSDRLGKIQTGISPYRYRGHGQLIMENKWNE